MNDQDQKKQMFLKKIDSKTVSKKGVLWEFEDDLLLARERGLTYKQIAEIITEITGQPISSRAVNYYVSRRLKNKKNLYKNKQKRSEVVPKLSDQNRLEILKQKTQKRKS